MRKLFLLLLVVAAAALNATSQSGRRATTPRPTQTAAPIQPPLNPEPELIRNTAPSVLLFLPESLRERQIKTVGKGSFRFADFHDRVLVINIWASWCGPCRREVPEYEKVRKAYEGRNVEFIGLTTEDPRTSSDRVNEFLRDTSFGFRLGWADRDTASTLMNGQKAIPQTLVIDADGHVINHWNGYSPGNSGNKLKQTIDQALKTAPRSGP